MKNDIKVRDPVCEMDVLEGAYKTTYMGSQYLFCSQQCLDRFKSNPKLYIGNPGKPSPKQMGKVLIKCRTIKLDRAIPGEIKVQLMLAFDEMMGIKDIEITNNEVRITYDLLEVTAEQIEQSIITTRVNLSDDWISRIKNAFIHYTEETELINLGSDSNPHCHQ